MKALVKNKGILGVAAFFIFAMFIYNSFFKSVPVEGPSDLSASNIGADLLKLNQDLQKVSLDQTLFSAPTYIFLTDLTTEVAPQPLGRPNPFDPIGRD
jgi:hypothetical protein